MGAYKGRFLICGEYNAFHLKIKFKRAEKSQKIPSQVSFLSDILFIFAIISMRVFSSTKYKIIVFN